MSTSLLNNGDGLTFRYIANLLETSLFATAYALQSQLNSIKLYRKTALSALFHCLLDYLHVIPFLVHCEFLLLF